MFNDPYWARFEFKTDYPFAVLVFNVTTLVRGFHPSEFKSPLGRSVPLRPQEHEAADGDARRLPDGARSAVSRSEAEGGASASRHTLAYQRTLRFENVPQARPPRSSASRGSELTEAERSRTSRTSSCGGSSS